jgi:hypothetical protein
VLAEVEAGRRGVVGRAQAMGGRSIGIVHPRLVVASGRPRRAKRDSRM